MPQRTCGTSGCPNAHRAKGLCSSCYNRQYQPDRHRKTTISCVVCGEPTLKAKRQRHQPVCSMYCRWFLQNPVLSCPIPASHPAHPDYQPPFERRIIWVAGRCGRCSRPFVDRHPDARYCSSVCASRAKQGRRRARRRGAEHVRYSRVDVFERDGYRCHLCKRLTLRAAVVPHPRAPVIDHLIPLGPGADAMHNVATACFLCNSVRRDVGPAQLLLFG
jgi:hypothetical protein